MVLRQASFLLPLILSAALPWATYGRSVTNTIAVPTMGNTKQKYAAGVVRPITGGNEVIIVPDEAANVLVVNPSTWQIKQQLATPAPTPSLPHKYSAAVAVGSKIYCIPFGANSIDIISGTTAAFTSSITENYCTADQMNSLIFSTPCEVKPLVVSQGLYADAVKVGSKLFLIPAFAGNVGILDTTTDRLDTFDISGLDSSTQQYSAGVYNSDSGKIYMVPHTADNIGIVDPTSHLIDTTTLLLSGPAVSMRYSDGVSVGSAVYLVPYKADKVARLNTATNALVEVTPALSSSFSSTGGGFLFSAGVLAPDGRTLFMVPDEAHSWLILDTVGDSITTQVQLTTTGTPQPGSFYRSGVLIGSDIVAVPGKAAQMAVVTTSSAAPTTGPTASPTPRPTEAPSTAPSSSPTSAPSTAPTTAPSKSPSKSPTKSPSNSPSTSPSKAPTFVPTASPSKSPTPLSASPTARPTWLELYGGNAAPGGVDRASTMLALVVAVVAAAALQQQA